MFGRLADGTVPTYRTRGRALFEREFRDDPYTRGGTWTGPEPRPTDQPAALIPACSCGWRGEDVPYDPDAGRWHTPDLETRHHAQENEAYGAWHRHADAALNPQLTDAHNELPDGIAELLDHLTRTRPRAALTLTRRLRELADNTEPLAVAAALTHTVAWDTIGADLGLTKQAVHARYRRPSRDLETRVHTLTGRTVAELITTATHRTPHSKKPSRPPEDTTAPAPAPEATHDTGAVPQPDPAGPAQPTTPGPGPAPGLTRAETELLDAAAPFLQTGGKGIAHTTYRALYELRQARVWNRTQGLPEVRTAAAGLAGRAIKLPDTDQGRRLREALTTYAEAFQEPRT
ncbi:hypothetical protein ACWC9H_27200 [Streptomyces sp. NPDC001251]